MKYNRKLLEEETLQKIKEVNDEAGYRSYLEVPEMVNIVASIMEDKFRVEYDDLVNQIHLLSKELDKAQIKAENLEAWEACADKLFSFAEIVRETEGNDVRNPHYYDSACKAIEQYKKLKENES